MGDAPISGSASGSRRKDAGCWRSQKRWQGLRCNALGVTDLGSRFIESRGDPIELDGQLVHMSHVLGPLPAGLLDLQMHVSGDLKQGVGISANGGWLTVNGVKSKQLVLWTSTAPERVEIALKPLRGRASLTVRIWNVWKHERWSSTMAWVGNAGLLVEAADPTAVRLHGSAGPGAPTFNDLVIDAKFNAT